MSILAAIFGFVRAILWRRARLALENLALRHQLAVLRQRASPLQDSQYSFQFLRGSDRHLNRRLSTLPPSKAGR